MSLVIAFAVSETGPQTAAGDYFTAFELGTALAERFGWQVRYLAKGRDWYELDGVDLVVVMTDDYHLPTVKTRYPRLVTVAWARNWFERWVFRPWMPDYDVVLASSRCAVQFLTTKLRKRVQLLRIATNPDRFNASKRIAEPEFDYVFTGSYWHSARDVVSAFSAVPSNFRGAVFGKNWEHVSELTHVWQGFVPYSQLNDVYRRANLVIDDANHVTKSWGAANSRVFDALAAGCLVITNSRSVSQEVFNGALPFYDSPDTLASAVQRYLLDQTARQTLVTDLRGLVLKYHCYRRRAFEFKLCCETILSLR